MQDKNEYIELCYNLTIRNNQLVIRTRLLIFSFYNFLFKLQVMNYYNRDNSYSDYKYPFLPSPIKYTPICICSIEAESN